MIARLLVNEPRLGIALPARTVRPFFRKGDEVLAAFLAALSTPAGEIAITGRLFHAAEPPAWLAGRVAGALRDAVATGARVTVPPDTPRPLLFLAAGVSLAGAPPLSGAPEFFRTGAFLLLSDGRREVRRVSVPGRKAVALDLTGLPIHEALGKIRRRLEALDGVLAIRLTLTGRTDEPELAAFGPRELLHFLPGGITGSVENRLTGPAGAEVFPDDETRRAALRAARERLPEPPAAIGVYEFLDDAGRPLYVGKAVDLRRRVASHFTAERREPSPRGAMLLAAKGLTFRETATEVEALLLEADRIRDARPPYNRKLREIEACRYLRAGLDDPLPTLRSIPMPVADGAGCYGPFPKRWVLERALRVLSVVHGLPCCQWEPGRAAPAACTDRDLSLCAAPCVGRASIDECRARARAALDHLLGRDGPEPAFGTRNPASAGLLGAEDLRVLTSFRRSFRWLAQALSDANGVIPLTGNRWLLVRGGLAAGVRRRPPAPPPPEPRTWVVPERAEEVRILARALRAARPAPAVASGPLPVTLPAI